MRCSSTWQDGLMEEGKSEDASLAEPIVWEVEGPGECNSISQDPTIVF